MKEERRKIKDVIEQHIKERNTHFVFPSIEERNYYVNNTLSSTVTAFETDRFLSFSSFIPSFFESGNLKKITKEEKILFCLQCLEENRFSHLFPSFSDKTLYPSVDKLLSLLPFLKSWHRVIEDKEKDEEDEEMEKIYILYTSFLKENSIYDPSFLSSPKEEKEKRYIIFYPSLVREYDTYKEELERCENITFFSPIEEEEKAPCILFDNVREEIRFLALRIRKLYLENVNLDSVAVSIADYGSLIPYVERELSLYGIPYKTEKKEISFITPSILLTKIKNLYTFGFTYTALSSFFLGLPFSWKEQEMNKELLRKAKEGRCVSNFKEDEELLFPLLGVEERNYAEGLKTCVKSIVESKSFSFLFSSFSSLKEILIDTEKMKEEDEITARIFDIVERKIKNFVKTEEKYSRSFYSPFSLLRNEVKGEKTEVYQESSYGVSLFPFFSASAASFSYHFVINATSDGLSIKQKDFPFIEKSEKRKALSLSEYSLTEKIIGAIKNESENFFFSSSSLNFSGFQIMSTALEKKELDEKEKKDLEDFDYLKKEREGFLNCDPALFASFYQKEKDAFAIWRKNSEENDRSSLSASFKDKVLSSLSKNEEIKASASSLNSFFKCPRKFLLEAMEINKEEEKTETIKANEFGTFLHSILENILLNFNRVIPHYDERDDFFYKAASSSFDKVLKESEICETETVRRILEGRKEVIVEIILSFLSELCSEFPGYKIIATEKYGEKETEDVLYTGIVDVLLRNPSSEKIAILDWKTGKAPSISESTSKDGILRNFQTAVYVVLTESGEDRVEEMAFCKPLEKDEKSFFTHVIGRSVKKSREEYSETLDTLSSYSSYFASKIKSFDFSPTHYYEDKKYGIKTLSECPNCSFSAICRTTFNIGGRSINGEN